MPADSPAKLGACGYRNFPNTKAGQLLSEHLDTIYATGPDAEAKYLSSLRALRTYGSEVLVTLVSVYDGTDRSLYGIRQVLIQTLADLKLDEAASVLIRISTEPVPSPQVRNGHSLNAYDEEILLRYIAIQGLAHLAVWNDAVARCLGALVRDAEPAVREEAVRSLAAAVLQAGGQERRTFLRQLLPKSALLNLQHSENRPTPIPDARSDLKPDNDLRRFKPR